MRWGAIAAGLALVALAFAAATRVADTREGLIAEVITLLSGLAGVGFLVYGLTLRRGLQSTGERVTGPPYHPRPHQRARKDLLLGLGGVALALILVGGLALSGGTLWAALGLVLLLPMIAGSVYLFVRFLRASP